MTTVTEDERRARSWRTSRWLGALLWATAVVVMLAAATYQRATGPTYPLDGTVEVGGAEIEYELTRSGTSTEDAMVQIPDPGVPVALVFRRYPLDEPYQRVPFEADSAGLAAPLPRQPAAGKLEYHLEMRTEGGIVRVPASPEADPIIRFKDPVPLAALIPHVIFMFFAILVGVRSGLAAALGRPDAGRYAWVALGLMSVGGLILGPVVQKHAFGAYWTGFPFGYDLTDNKTLVMWLVWVGAVGVLAWERRRGMVGRPDVGRARPGPGRTGRAAILLATGVMLLVYLVPHSFRGSELDYERLEEGVDPEEAIRTG